jgi:hypothetical protein
VRKVARAVIERAQAVKHQSVLRHRLHFERNDAIGSMSRMGPRCPSERRRLHS